MVIYMEVKKKIKSNRIKLHQEEKKTKPKPENKKNNYNIKYNNNVIYL